MNRLSLSLSLFVSVLFIGCTDITTVVVLTDAPPGRVAEVDNDDETIRISSGVAVAIECYFRASGDVSSYGNGLPCDEMTVTVDAPERADVLPAHLEGSPWGSPYDGGYAYDEYGNSPPVDPQGRDRALVVLVGREPGTSTLELVHADGALRFALEVLATSSEAE